MPVSSEINFIPNASKESPTIKDQIFQWVIKNGKRIVIVTQIIVLLVFISRFKFDNDIRGVTTEIEKNEAVVESLSDVEKQYVDNQHKLGLVKPIIDHQINWEDRLKNFTKKIPDDLILEKVRFSENKVDLQARTKNSQSFQVFIGLLLSDDSITSVTLSSSQFNSQQEEYSFAINLDLK